MSELHLKTLQLDSHFRTLPEVSHAWGVLPRERFSCLSHAVSAAFAAVGLALLLVVAQGDAMLTLLATIYGVSAVLMFSASALYHANKRKDDEISLWRRLDHSAIFVMIAGTFTPICFIHLNPTWFYSIVGAQWILVAVGIFFKLAWLRAPRWLTTGIYLAMGWMAVIAVVPFVESMSRFELSLLAAGGLSYSTGAVVYGLKKPDFWPNLVGFHGLFHLFVMGGALSHFWLIYRSVAAAKIALG